MILQVAIEIFKNKIFVGIFSNKFREKIFKGTLPLKIRAIILKHSLY
jgi:hypothetical protein